MKEFYIVVNNAEIHFEAENMQDAIMVSADMGISPAPAVFEKSEQSPLLDLLRELEEYFDQRSDADFDQGGYIPNAEMRLLIAVRQEIAKATGVNHA